MATLVQSAPVDERHNGPPVWQGVVHVFDISGHPKAKRAWSSPIEGSSKRQAVAKQPENERVDEGCSYRPVGRDVAIVPNVSAATCQIPG